jgi:hypothetical protein
MKLRKIVFNRAPARIPSVRAGDLTELDLDNPPQALYGWRISVRGQSIFLISPPGWDWSNSTSPTARDPKGPSLVVEVPRAETFLFWGEVDDVEAMFKNTRFDGAPLAGKVIVTGEGPILANIPPGQLGD